MTAVVRFAHHRTLWLKSIEVPVQISWKPLPKPELGLSTSPLPPDCRDLGNSIATQKCLDRQLQINLKTRLALDLYCPEHCGIIKLERIARVMCWNSTEPAKRKTCDARERLLYKWPVHDTTAPHIATSRN